MCLLKYTWDWATHADKSALWYTLEYFTKYRIMWCIHKFNPTCFPWTPWYFSWGYVYGMLVSLQEWGQIREYEKIGGVAWDGIKFHWSSLRFIAFLFPFSIFFPGSLSLCLFYSYFLYYWPCLIVFILNPYFQSHMIVWNEHFSDYSSPPPEDNFF